MPQATEPEARPYRVVDGVTGNDMPDADLDAKLAGARVVYVGEAHDNPHHHYVQVQVFERMLGQTGGGSAAIGLGMEMLSRDKQPALTAFVEEATDEAAFLAAIDWEKTWGFPFGLYRPLLALCRKHDLPAHALNIPRDLTRAVAKKGTQGLSDEERAQMPELEPGPAGHREYAREAYGKHSMSRFTDSKFERFYAAQLTWDEAMAESVARALEGQASMRMLVVAGEGHTRRWAIPDRAARRGAGPHVTVLAIEPGELESAIADQVADVLYVFEDEKNRLRSPNLNRVRTWAGVSP